MSSLQIVVPVWQDDAALDRLLDQLAPWRAEVWVVDGAASPATESVVRLRAKYLRAEQASRGAQIAAGIAQSDAPWVWVLHADTVLPAASVAFLQGLILEDQPRWGRFDVELPGLALIAFMMNWRSRLSRICTGDQGMFFHRQLLEDVGGFPSQPLMEDIEVSKRLKQQARDDFIASRLTIRSSTRRWQKLGVARTVVAMWWFRWRYFRGTPAAELFRDYYGREA